jgi:phosphatidylserine decarboxylase
MRINNQIRQPNKTQQNPTHFSVLNDHARPRKTNPRHSPDTLQQDAQIATTFQLLLRVFLRAIAPSRHIPPPQPTPRHTAQQVYLEKCKTKPCVTMALRTTFPTLTSAQVPPNFKTMSLTPHGQREMIVGTIVLIVVGVLLSFIHPALFLLVVPVFIWLFAFFRDPDRFITKDTKAMVSPADGTVSDITDLESCDLVGGGPAVRIGIFLSVFNVHINRSPCDGNVAEVIYKKGKFINAMSHSQASSDNESNTIILNEPGTTTPLCAVKQIVGLIARRIICTVAPPQPVLRGQRIGMIKFGSRTELYLPKHLEPKVLVQVGAKVHGGHDVLATINKPIAHPTLLNRPAPKKKPVADEAIPLD